MSSMALRGSIIKFIHLGSAMARRSPWRPRVLVTSSLEPKAYERRNEAKGELMKNARGVTTSAGDQVVESGQDFAAKAKQTVQDAWGSAKETAEEVKDSMIGKAEDTKESIKDNAESVKRAMNTKNC